MRLSMGAEMKKDVVDANCVVGEVENFEYKV